MPNTNPKQNRGFRNLNLGCGRDLMEGWWNVDIVPLPGVIVHDLNIVPWPFKDNSADEIQALDILEHVDNVVSFIEECHRILKKDGKLFIRTPRYDAEFLWIDPTHKRGFHEQSMDFFDPSTVFGQSPISEAKFSVIATVMPNLNLTFVMIKQ